MRHLKFLPIFALLAWSNAYPYDNYELASFYAKCTAASQEIISSPYADAQLKAQLQAPLKLYRSLVTQFMNKSGILAAVEIESAIKNIKSMNSQQIMDITYQCAKRTNDIMELIKN